MTPEEEERVITMAKKKKCGFCGHPDHRHRMVDSIVERVVADFDALDDVLHEYGLTPDGFLRLVVEVQQAEQEYVEPSMSGPPDDEGLHPREMWACAFTGKLSDACCHSRTECHQVMVYVGEPI